jgi:phosphomannomutase
VVLEEARVLLKKLGIKEVQTGFDAAFAFDSDADRLLVFDKDDKRVRSDFIIAFLARRKKGFFSKAKLVYSLNFSKAVIEKLEQWDIKSYKTKIGRPHVREAMIEHRADLGGELSGHILFKDNNYSELPLMAMLLVIKFFVEQGKDFNKISGQFGGWFNSGEINVDIEHSPEQMTELAELLRSKYPDGKCEEMDGITMEYSDWWFNLRRSNTEPLLRLVVEAKTKELLEDKVGEITKWVGGQ